jgi:hypothetical protein
VRLLAARGRYQVAVPVALTDVWLVALNEVPSHHLPVEVSSMATDTAEMVAPGPAEAVPVIVPVQLAP